MLYLAGICGCVVLAALLFDRHWERFVSKPSEEGDRLLLSPGVIGLDADRGDSERESGSGDGALLVLEVSREDFLFFAVGWFVGSEVFMCVGCEGFEELGCLLAVCFVAKKVCCRESGCRSVSDDLCGSADLLQKVHVLVREFLDDRAG